MYMRIAGRSQTKKDIIELQNKIAALETKLESELDVNKRMVIQRDITSYQLRIERLEFMMHSKDSYLNDIKEVRTGEINMNL